MGNLLKPSPHENGLPKNGAHHVMPHAAAVNALQRREVSERLISLGLEPVGSTPAQLATHLKTEMTRWARLAREVKFEAVD